MARFVLAHSPSVVSFGRVLVIEDDEEIRTFVTMALGDEGYEVTGVPNGAVALDLLTQPGATAPDVILLDLRMPVMDGWAFAAAYRQLPGRRAPVVAVTAAPDIEESAAQVQADAYLGKPFELDDLLDTVDRYAGQGSPA